MVRVRQRQLAEKQNLESTEKSPGESKRFRLYSILRQSTFLMLLVTLSSFYTTLCIFYPWQSLASLDMPEWILRFAGDCVEYVNRGKRKDVVILGSSLIAAVSSRLEPRSNATGTEVKFNADGNIYEKALAHCNCQAKTVAFAAVPGAMVSDQRLILSKLVEAKKAPAILVFTYAPRDFIDNEVGDKLNDTPTQRVFNFYSKNMSFLPSNLRPETLVDCFERHRAFIDLLRRQTFRQIKAEACQRTGHAENLWMAMHQKKVANGGNSANLTQQQPSQTVGPEMGNLNDENALKEDLVLYRKRYLPVDQKKLQVQLRNLELMLAQAKTEKIKVLLFGMPISRENANILPIETRQMLANEINRIAKRNDVRLEDLNRSDKCNFQLNDYVDSVHLNKAGSIKLLPLLVKCISSL